jgi:hypothetical protein
MLICERLRVGKVYVYGHFAIYIVTSQNDLSKIFAIFDKSPLNTSKHLNYLEFKKAFCHGAPPHGGHKVDNLELRKEILTLKDSMNKKRINYKQPVDHCIKITPYWLLGFVEAEGYFSVATSNHRLEFGSVRLSLTRLQLILVMLFLLICLFKLLIWIFLFYFLFLLQQYMITRIHTRHWQ